MQERNSKQEEALFTLLMDQVARQENQQAREAAVHTDHSAGPSAPGSALRRTGAAAAGGPGSGDSGSGGAVLLGSLCRVPDPAVPDGSLGGGNLRHPYPAAPRVPDGPQRRVLPPLRADGGPAAYRGDPDGNKPEPGDLVLPLCRRRRLLAGDQADGFQRRRRHVRGHGGRRYAPADHQRLSCIHHPQKRDVHRRVHAG